MRFLIDKISRLGIGWNDRRLDESDFYGLCKRFAIEVVETPMRTDGFYFRLMGRDFITVDSKLAGPRRLAVMFHELGHFLFHTPETGPSVGFHGVGPRVRKEREADVFAICAVIPRPMLESHPIKDLADDGLTDEMIARRFEVLRRYGL